MNDVLLEAFRHSAWASEQLLAACHGLSEDQLTSSAVGTYGGILATFNHLIRSDIGYIPRLTGRPSWAEGDDTSDLDQLKARVEETAQLWERFLSEPVDAERLLILDEGTYEAETSVLVVQALHHANVHREQICAILTGFGIQPPDVQAWAYADAMGKGRERTASN